MAVEIEGKRETILETQAPWDILVQTGTIEGTVATNVITGTGTNFEDNFVSGDLIRYTDSAGKINYGTVADTSSDTSMTLVDNLPVGIVAGTTFYKVTDTLVIDATSGVPTSPYIITNDLNTRALYPTKVPIYMPKVNNQGPLLVGTMNRQSAPTPLKVAYFSNREGILIKSVYVRLPYQYTLADNCFDIAFYYVTEDGLNFAEIKNIGVLGRIFLDTENIEIPINQFILPYQKAIDTDQNWGIRLNPIYSHGSQYEVALLSDVALERITMVAQTEQPDEMKNLYLPVVIGMRVQHGIDMVAS